MIHVESSSSLQVFITTSGPSEGTLAKSWMKRVQQSTSSITTLFHITVLRMDECFSLKTVKWCGSVTRCHKCHLSSLCFRGQVTKDSKDEAARSTSCNTASSSEPLMRKRSWRSMEQHSTAPSRDQNVLRGKTARRWFNSDLDDFVFQNFSSCFPPHVLRYRCGIWL